MGFDELQAAIESVLARVDLEADRGEVEFGRFELAGPDVEAGSIPLFVVTRAEGLSGHPWLVGSVR